ncbi:MAG: hypothetical protein PHW60_01615 [Kiritimatiellae bacterium]|nr:hypothetical protein [Kiritimatiellia bacterium]
MKKIKYNLKELMADAEKDEAATRPVYKIISQDNIAELLKKAKRPASAANQNGT